MWNVSNHFLRTERYTRFADWRFVFAARLGCVSLNGYRRWLEQQSASDKQCRKTNCSEVETLPHVLNHCKVHWRAIRLRHDAIQNRLVAAIPETAGVTIQTDKTVPGTPSWLVAPGGNRLRPDIVITDTARKKMKIVDVAVAFEI